MVFTEVIKITKNDLKQKVIQFIYYRDSKIIISMILYQFLPKRYLLSKFDVSMCIAITRNVFNFMTNRKVESKTFNLIFNKEALFLICKKKIIL